MNRWEIKIESDKDEENLFQQYARMEDLLEKLKILNYETEFISTLKMRPIHKYYFVTTKNPGEQFFLFSSLAAWLIRKSGGSIEPPQEYDDPNITIVNILEVLREKGAVIDFPPNKLKQGVGEHVVYVLDYLANEALKTVNFSWQSPRAPVEKEQKTEVIEDESELFLDQIEEEMMINFSDDSDEENIFALNDFTNRKASLQKQELDIKANIDLEAWKLELERALPQLKVTIKADSRDWRAHLDQMRGHRNSTETTLKTTKTNLEKLHKEISATLEKIDNRERYLNKELDPVLDEYRLLKDRSSKIKESYRSISGGVTERTRHLAHLTDKMETIKQQMEERGSSMTDGTPLVNIKKAIAKIKMEITEMDVRIAVLDCLLLQTKIREKYMLDQDLYQTTNMF